MGLSEDEARKQGHDPIIGKFAFAALGRAIAIAHTEGFVKVVADTRVEAPPRRHHVRPGGVRPHRRGGARPGDGRLPRGRRAHHPRPPDAARGLHGGLQGGARGGHPRANRPERPRSAEAAGRRRAHDARPSARSSSTGSAASSTPTASRSCGSRARRCAPRIRRTDHLFLLEHPPVLTFGRSAAGRTSSRRRPGSSGKGSSSTRPTAAAT